LSDDDRLVCSGGAPVRGRLAVPGDKSISHRAILLAALTKGTSRIEGASTGGDVLASLSAVRQLGVAVEGDLTDGLRLTPPRGGLSEPSGVLDLANSGTGLRLLAGVLAGLPIFSVLVGDRSLQSRPMARVVEPLRAMGAVIDGRDGGRFAPLAIRGGELSGIDYTPPIASAQVKSAILLAGLSARGETVVREALRTRSHTEEMLAAAGARIAVTEVGEGRIVTLEPSALSPVGVTVPGDPSQAAFFVVAASIIPGSDLRVEGLYAGPGRLGFLAVLERMGAEIELHETGELVADLVVRSAALRATVVGSGEVPGLIDEVPALAVAAAFAEGETVFRGVGELATKESDRLAAITSELGALGGQVRVVGDELVVTGDRSKMHSGTVDCQGDHRIAMAMAIVGAALGPGEAVEVSGASAIATSYPDFARDLERVRGSTRQ